MQAEKLVYWGGGRCDTGRMSSTNHDVGATEDAEAEEGQGCRVGRGGGKSSINHDTGADESEGAV